MKTLSLFLLSAFQLFSFSALAQPFIGPALMLAPAAAGSGGGGGGSTCTMLVSNEVTNYNSDSWGGTPSQQVSNTVSMTICGAGFYSSSGDTGNYLEIRTAPDGGGTLLTTSETLSMGVGWTVFSFSSPYTVAPGTVVYVNLIRNGGNNVRLVFTANQEGLGASYLGASPISDSWNFMLNTVQ